MFSLMSLLLYVQLAASISNFMPILADSPLLLPVAVDQLRHEEVISIADRQEALVKRQLIPHPRLGVQGHGHSKRISANPLAAMLQARALSCDPGYNYCAASGRCCPSENGSGRCCNDGTCVTSSDTCCPGGLACRATEDCCGTGCKPKDYACCPLDWQCEPGLKCCSDRNCAPEGGECCSGRSSCGPGLKCVTLNGRKGCCKDKSCSEFDSPVVGSSDLISATISLTTKIPLSTVALVYSTYTTTYTFYYTTYFLITVVQTTMETSSRVTTSTVLSRYASNSAAAQSYFDDATATITFSGQATAPAYASFIATATSSPTAGGTPRSGNALRTEWPGWLAMIVLLLGSAVGMVVL